jgi:hypothetical protein
VSVGRLGIPGIDRLSALPSDVIEGLRTIPRIVESTRRIEGHTSDLAIVARALEGVKRDTEALPGIRADMAAVAEQTSVLHGMDGRMATIEEAMPVLVEVQRHLAKLPETIEALDEKIGRMSDLMEKLMVALDELNGSVASLHGAVEPMGRLASRVPGQRRSHADEAAE